MAELMDCYFDISALVQYLRTRMKQAEEDKDKLPERGIAAFDYLQSVKTKWDKQGGL
jgi:hypothetical protein